MTNCSVLVFADASTKLPYNDGWIIRAAAVLYVAQTPQTSIFKLGASSPTLVHKLWLSLSFVNYASLFMECTGSCLWTLFFLLSYGLTSRRPCLFRECLYLVVPSLPRPVQFYTEDQTRLPSSTQHMCESCPMRNMSNPDTISISRYKALFKDPTLTF